MQRNFRFNAPMHMRQHFVHAHVDKSLKGKLKLARRSVQIAKGDTVKIMTGSKRGTSGKVLTVSLKSGKITIDGLIRKTARGKEYHVPVNVSSVYITDLNLSDKYRAAKLKVAQQAAPAKKEEPKKEAKQENRPATAPTQQNPQAQQPQDKAQADK